MFTFDWVLVDKLALGPCPLKERHVEILKRNNIQSILSLCSEEEAKSPLSMKNQFICERIVLPDHKYKEVLTMQQINEALVLLQSLMSNGPVFVHCKASVERSPLICMAWLVKKCNLNNFEALDYLMQIHPITNPLPNQFELLKDLKDNLNK